MLADTTDSGSPAPQHFAVCLPTRRLPLLLGCCHDIATVAVCSCTLSARAGAAIAGGQGPGVFPEVCSAARWCCIPIIVQREAACRICICVHLGQPQRQLDLGHLRGARAIVRDRQLRPAAEPVRSLKTAKHC
jgi:hypothetical protein